jgi:hypothetical protein
VVKKILMLLMLGGSAMAQPNFTKIDATNSLPVTVTIDSKNFWVPFDTAPKSRQIWVWAVGKSFGGDASYQGVIYWQSILLLGQPPHWVGIPEGLTPKYWRDLPDPPETK